MGQGIKNKNTKLKIKIKIGISPGNKIGRQYINSKRIFCHEEACF